MNKLKVGDYVKIGEDLGEEWDNKYIKVTKVEDCTVGGQKFYFMYLIEGKSYDGWDYFMNVKADSKYYSRMCTPRSEWYEICEK